jgi:hypothetical protein
MRRSQCEITDPGQMERILSLAMVGRLATKDVQGYPYITPVNFVFLEGAVFFHGAPEGEKLNNLRRDDRVCFEVDVPLAYVGVDFNRERLPCLVHQLYHSVIIRGRARVLPEGEMKTRVLNALVARHESGADFPPVTSDSPGYSGCLVVEVRPERMTGKSDLAQSRTAPGRQRVVAEGLLKRGLPGDLLAVEAMGFETAGDDNGGRRFKD